MCMCVIQREREHKHPLSYLANCQGTLLYFAYLESKALTKMISILISKGMLRLDSIQSPLYSGQETSLMMNN